MRNEERGTLKDFSTDMSDEDKGRRDRLLILMHLLSTLQMECGKEIEELLNKGSVYRHEVKHNHRQIQALIRKNMKNIFGNMAIEEIDRYCEDFDELKQLIFKWSNV